MSYKKITHGSMHEMSERMLDLKHCAQETNWTELFGDKVPPYARRYVRDGILMDIYFTSMKVCVMIKPEGAFNLIPHWRKIKEREELVELFNNPNYYKQLL